MREKETISKKTLITASIIIVLLIALVIFYDIKSKNTPEINLTENQKIELAKCLFSKQVRYFYLDTCSHCQQQKADFGEGYQFLLKDECSDNSCPSSITAVPTWIMPNGERLSGRQSLELLSEKAECAIN